MTGTIDRFAHYFRAAVTAAVTIGLVQATLGALSIALLYRDMVLAPYAFFNLEIYDAFSKLYSMLTGPLGLPPVLDQFLAPGFVTKLPVVVPLVLINVSLGILLAVLAALLLTSLRISPRSTPRQEACRALTLFVAFEFVVHMSLYIGRVHMPDDGSLTKILLNSARDLRSGGTGMALLLLMTSAGLSRMILRQSARRLGTVATAVVSILIVSWIAETNAAPTPSVVPTATPLSIAKDYNVVLISIDSLRADHVSAYGYDRPTTPTIDAMAEAGVRLANASSTTSWTLPAHISMLTGRSLLSHGVVTDDRRLSTEVPTIARVLQDAGYRTGAIVGGPYVNSRYGFAQGFDHYDDATVSYTEYSEHTTTVTSPLINGAADAWLDNNASERFFLFLHYWDVHYDYNPPPPYDAMFDPDYRGNATGVNFYHNPAVNRHMERTDLDHIVAMYDGEIRYVDDHLAKLRAKLTQLDVQERTILIVTADHGDEFFEHGNKGHHRTLYDEVLRVPLVIYVPGRTPSRSVVQSETSIVDIFPTIVSLLGLEAPAGLDGVDLTPLAFADSPETDRATMSELYRPEAMNMQASLRDSRFKVTQHFKHWLMETYDMKADASESNLLANSLDASAAMGTRLAVRMNEHWPAFREQLELAADRKVTVDATVKEGLRSLGYVE